MSDMADEVETLLARNRSLRTRRTLVDYSEDEMEESTIAPSREKKRGSKRKAELNIESLYCQENVKEVCPSSLETIFESPQKGSSRSHPKSSKIVKNVLETAAVEQVMSVKKWKRFCSFSNYYHPSKQKTKVRKDRAKKLKQLTGVKVPKGSVSDAALQTALAILSDEEDRNENFQNNIVNKTPTSFYIGNIIRPDVEDTSINDVIKNISSMQMITESSTQQEILHKAILEEIDAPLLFSSEDGIDRPTPTHQRKSRRRSEKFSGSLLPRSSKIMEDLPESINEGEVKYLDGCESEQVPTEDMIDVKVAPKRRNVLSDKKVIKKTKLYELTRKRQSESKEEQCQKKRGNLKDYIGNPTIIQESVDEDCDEVSFIKRMKTSLRGCIEHPRDLTTRLSENELLGSQKIDLNSLHVNQNINQSVRGKKRGKRRVSGVQRPLYRTILEPPSPEEVFENQNQSPNYNSADDSSSGCLNTTTVPLQEVNVKCSSAGITSSVAISSAQGTTMTYPSPTSPCTQMAALSLQSEREGDMGHMPQSNLKAEVLKKRARRRSQQFSAASMVAALPSKFPISAAVSLSSVITSVDIQIRNEKAELLEETNTLAKKMEMCQEVQNRNGKELSNTCNQFEIALDVKSASTESEVMNNGLGDYSVAPELKQSIPSTCSAMNDGIPSSTTDVKHESPSDKKVEILCSASSQPDVEYSGNSLASKYFNCEIIEDSEGLDSPIITGIIENKAKIRYGKMYHNKKVV